MRAAARSAWSPPAGEPFAGLGEPADIFEMIAQIGAGHAQRGGIRRAAALLAVHVALVNALAHQRGSVDSTYIFSLNHEVSRRTSFNIILKFSAHPIFYSIY